MNGIAVFLRNDSRSGHITDGEAERWGSVDGNSAFVRNGGDDGCNGGEEARA